MQPIKVVIYGAAGRVGQILLNNLSHEPEVKLVGAVDVLAKKDTLALPDETTIPYSADLAKILNIAQPQVMVDFTIAKATMPAARLAIKQGINLVIGTTGLTNDDMLGLDQMAMANKVGVVVASNFALGAVLMTHFAKIAAKYLDSAEIIELHHNQKADAPSGTSLFTAKGMASARGKPFLRSAEQDKSFPSRGENIQGINIHSVRLPGFMAHQEVLFGGLGQTLSIRHDTIGRECYVPGVLLAIKEVINRQGLVVGLDKLMGL